MRRSRGVFARSLVAAVFVTAVAAALWAGEVLTPGDDSKADAASRSAAAKESIPVETWARRAGAICEWEERHTKDFLRALRKAQTYADAEVRMAGASRLLEKSVAMFRRLPPPAGFEDERNRIVRLLKRQQALGKAMVDDVRHHDHRALFRGARRMLEVNHRISKIMVHLGVEGCVPIPKEKLPSERRLVV